MPGDFIFDLVSHPWFQRLRNIRQLGLSSYVYPGAVHSRFQHSLGAMYLTSLVVNTLRSKDVSISKQEEQAVLIAILLHDIGHGPFSHALEHSIIEDMPHERMSLLIMEELNRIFEGGLTDAIAVFNGSCARRFFHDLVTGQMDMDRMDYLRRDSFFTGVVLVLVLDPRWLDFEESAGRLEDSQRPARRRQIRFEVGWTGSMSAKPARSRQTIVSKRARSR